MKATARHLASCLILACLAAPVTATSLSATRGPGPAMPEISPAVLPLAADQVSGSATLVPLVAAVDMQAGQSSGLDASTTGPIGGAKTMDDFLFLARASESARRDASSAREALPQIKNPDLKRIAQRLIAEHQDANAKLVTVATVRNWPLPAAPAPHDSPPAGTALAGFDAKWTAEMIAAQEEAKALYGAQAQGGEDAELRRFARDALPTIENHLAELRRLQK